MSQKKIQPDQLRSRKWFNNPEDLEMTALYLERYLNYGLTRDELQSGKPIIGIDASERRFRNLFVEGMITEKVHDISAIIPAIKRKFSE